MKRIKDPTIAKEKYQYIAHVKEKLSYEKWVEFIDAHQNYYTWYEHTEEGNNLMSRIEVVPANFREGVIRSLNKIKAFAEYNHKKGYHEVLVAFLPEFGIVHTTFMKPIRKEHLRRLLDMANYLDAHLLNNGSKIIDEKVIERLLK